MTCAAFSWRQLHIQIDRYQLWRPVAIDRGPCISLQNSFGFFFHFRISQDRKPSSASRPGAWLETPCHNYHDWGWFIHAPPIKTWWLGDGCGWFILGLILWFNYMKSQKSNVSLAAWRSKKTGRLLTASPSISATRAQWGACWQHLPVSQRQELNGTTSGFHSMFLAFRYRCSMRNCYRLHMMYMSHSWAIHVPFISHPILERSESQLTALSSAACWCPAEFGSCSRRPPVE